MGSNAGDGGGFVCRLRWVVRASAATDCIVHCHVTNTLRIWSMHHLCTGPYVSSGVSSLPPSMRVSLPTLCASQPCWRCRCILANRRRSASTTALAQSAPSLCHCAKSFRALHICDRGWCFTQIKSVIELRDMNLTCTCYSSAAASLSFDGPPSSAILRAQELCSLSSLRWAVECHAMRGWPGAAVFGGIAAGRMMLPQAGRLA